MTLDCPSVRPDSVGEVRSELSGPAFVFMARAVVSIESETNIRSLEGSHLHNKSGPPKSSVAMVFIQRRFLIYSNCEVPPWRSGYVCGTAPSPVIALGSGSVEVDHSGLRREL